MRITFIVSKEIAEHNERPTQIELVDDLFGNNSVAVAKSMLKFYYPTLTMDNYSLYFGERRLDNPHETLLDLRKKSKGQLVLTARYNRKCCPLCQMI